jgi:hypothetical protein
MELRRFKREYDLNLIPSSHAGLTPGTLVWDPLFGRARFDHKGMANHLLNAFHDADLITQEEWKALHEEIQQAPLEAAVLAEKSLEMEYDAAAELNDPRLGKLEAHLEMEKMRRIRFGALEVRRLSNEMRMTFDDYLETLRKERWTEYDGSLRRLFLITELYYGRLEISVDQSHKAQVEAALNGPGLNGTLQSEGHKKSSYSFAHGNVPFAMRLERVKHFNG